MTGILRYVGALAGFLCIGVIGAVVLFFICLMALYVLSCDFIYQARKRG